MVPFYFSASNNFLPNSPRIIVPSVMIFSQVNSVQACPLQVRTTYTSLTWTQPERLVNFILMRKLMQQVKDPAPLHSRACAQLKADRRWCCTGTPINTSIYDLYGQVTMSFFSCLIKCNL